MMDRDFEQICLCCWNSIEQYSTYAARNSPIWYYRCKMCKVEYAITQSAINSMISNQRDAYKVSSFVGRKSLCDKQKILICANRSELYSQTSQELNLYEVDEILRWFPESITDIFDSILLNLFALEPKPSATIPISYQTGGQPVPLLFAQDYKVAKFYLDAIEKDGFISSVSISGNIWEIKIQPEGFNRIYHLQRTDPALSKDVFVALDFTHKDAYYQAIEPTLESLKFKPICLLDQNNHDHIDNAISAGIRKSRFIVADLTFKNRGAYWEAGLAYGQQKVVILCCQQLEGEKPEELVHFDLNHFKILFYKDWVDLKKQLKDRIEGDGRIAL